MIILRSTHDAIVALYKERLADKDGELERTRTDFREAQMRERLALAEPKTTPVPAAPPKREPSEIDTAIALAANGDRRLRQHLANFARKAQMEGVGEDDIVQKILHGEPSLDDEGIE